MPYYPQGNGQAKASNKTIIKILKKTVNDAGHDWHIQLNPTSWAYHTSIRTPTGATPFALVFISKAIMPIKVEIPSLWVSLKGLIDDEEYRQSQLHELEMLEECKHNALNHLQAYQNRLCCSYNKRVMVRKFDIGDFVLMQNPKNQSDREKLGKFEPNWLGPYIITSSFNYGSYQLATLDDEQLTEPINNLHLRKFYAKNQKVWLKIKTKKWKYKKIVTLMKT